MTSEKAIRQTGQSALLLLDFHKAIVASHGEAGDEAVTKATRALSAARRHGCPVFHIVPHYRDGYPELPQGEPFDSVKAAGLFRESTCAEGIVPPLAARHDEAIISKCRYSPFYASELAHLLRMARVDTLILAGIATSGAVLSAVRDAWDLDYRITVLRDACTDPDAAVHELLLNKIMSAQARILDVATWTEEIATSSA
jgi:nicotinamidase-related amidase